MEQYFGFVLFLSVADNDVLLPVITKLQKEYCNQPPFEPHVSIYHSVKLTSLTDTITAISRAISKVKPFMVESEGFDSGPVWSRIFYIKIKPNLILDEIRANIGKELGDTEIRSFIPHISLMYKDELSSIERNKIIGRLQIPNTFIIQGIQIISPGTLDNDWRDYTKWEAVHSATFPKQ